MSAVDLEAGLHRAALVDGACVVALPDAATETAYDELVDVLVRSTTRAVLLAEQPLRRPRLWATRRMAELSAAAPGRADARRLWAAAFPALAGDAVDDLAGRYALGADDITAVSALDRAAGSWAHNGNRPGLDELAARVARPRSSIPELASAGSCTAYSR